jgi:hypothetical protein
MLMLEEIPQALMLVEWKLTGTREQLMMSKFGARTSKHRVLTMQRMHWTDSLWMDVDLCGWLVMATTM